ncbi:hypothetical protein EEW87_001895 [Janibacter melonis]|uniref:Uncharacterized protein n=1 Tax=Janibacter melonis TaxID=262209 RepID=A0A5P8FJK3_9MICO|nr:hypothetical protein [Janibacter melonis]QFQ29341.2 hypothetical protein EEW87_001895 [Janibacter melonis]
MAGRPFRLDTKRTLVIALGLIVAFLFGFVSTSWPTEVIAAVFVVIASAFVIVLLRMTKPAGRRR